MIIKSSMMMKIRVCIPLTKASTSVNLSRTGTTITMAMETTTLGSRMRMKMTIVTMRALRFEGPQTSEMESKNERTDCV
jgi:hypothetical protein